ncbi:PDIL1-4 [Symbiodinium sp. KB8]|nr:PDIL1-4 [Symbiodinium sp. KB8]
MCTHFNLEDTPERSNPKPETPKSLNPKRIPSAAKASLTSSTFDGFVRGADKVLIDFYDRKIDGWAEQKSELEQALRQVRDYGSDVAFATVDASTEEDLAKRYVVSGRFPQLLWFTHGEPTQYHRTLRTAKAMADFVLALDREPMMQVKSEQEASSSFNRAVFGKVKKGSSLYKALEVVATKHMDTVAVTYVDSSENDIKFLDEMKPEPIPYSGRLDVESLDAWVRDLLTKSEPIPEGHPVYQEGSLVVVGKTFEEAVSHRDKDVFMLVYAPWCGFSRKFFPVWNAFAQAVSNAKSLIVAKMDGDQNSSPLPDDFMWTSYPHIFFVKAGTKKPILFHGNRTVSHLVQFAEEHGTKPLDLDPSINLDDINEL